MIGFKTPAPPVPQLQAPQRRFLRQEMVIEVVRRVLLSACLSSLPPYFLHMPAHTRCPWLSLLFHPNRSPRLSPNSASASGQLGEPSPLPGPGCPLGHCGQEGGPLGLNPASGPTEGSRWQEGPVPLSVHGPHRLHHPEEEVRLLAAQLHEPVSGPGGCGVGWGWGSGSSCQSRGPLPCPGLSTP